MDPARKVKGKTRVYVCTNTDLRMSKEEKFAHATGGWRIFVNRRGRLAHGVHGASEVLVRMEAPFDLEGCAPEYVDRIFSMRLKHAMEDLR